MSKSEAKLTDKIDQLKNVAMESLELQMARVGKIEEIADHSQQLMVSSEKFRDTSRSVKKKYCMENWKCWIGIIVISLVLLLILLMVLCDPNFNKCKSDK